MAENRRILITDARLGPDHGPGFAAQVFGARLVPGTPWTVSGESVFPSQKRHVEHLKGQIREAEEVDGADEVELRRLRSMLIIYGWVFILARASPESFTAAAAGLRTPS